MMAMIIMCYEAALYGFILMVAFSVFRKENESLLCHTSFRGKLDFN